MVVKTANFPLWETSTSSKKGNRSKPSHPLHFRLSVATLEAVTQCWIDIFLESFQCFWKYCRISATGYFCVAHCQKFLITSPLKIAASIWTCQAKEGWWLPAGIAAGRQRQTLNVWEVNGCANHHKKHFSLVQSRIGETAGTLSGVLEQDEQKLSHRIRGFLGLGLQCGSFAFEFCLLGRNKQARNR